MNATMPPKIRQQVAELEKNLATRRAKLAALHGDYDAADERGDAALKAQLQTEIADANLGIASAERRIANARAQANTAVRAELANENSKRDKAVAAELRRQQQIAEALPEAVDNLAEILKALHASGATAREHVAPLVHQLPRDHMRDPYVNAMHAISFDNGMLGALVADLLQKAGVFTDLAPNTNINLGRHDFTSVAEVFAKRTEKLSAVVGRLAEQINAEV